MTSLPIAASCFEARVSAGRPASIHLELPGWTGRSNPTVSIAPAEGGPDYPWVSVDVSSIGRTTSVAVIFDPSIGPRPCHGSYPVQVSVWTGQRWASTTVRFVVDRHPCLEIDPKPSLTWDPLTNTASLKLAIWSCGNVDLDVSWSVALMGRRLEAEPATVKIAADGSVVDATLTIKLPDGEVDLDTEIDFAALSEAEAKLFKRPLAAPRSEPSPARSGSGRLFGLTLLAAILVVGTAGVAILQTRNPLKVSTAEPVLDLGSDASVASTTSSTSASALSTTSPKTTEESLIPPAVAKLVAETDLQQEVTVNLGERGEATFLIANRGGSDADVDVTELREQNPFALALGGCEGSLEPGDQCVVEIAFEPAKAGTYTDHVIVTDSRTGQSLTLTVTGIAYTVDLIPSISESPLQKSGCPDKAQECFKFSVTNLGDGRSSATVADVLTLTDSASVAVGPMEPGEELQLVVAIAGACQHGCSVSVAIDPSESLLESNEDNNVAYWNVEG